MLCTDSYVIRIVYASLMCRSHDGQLLVVSSTDGYCTLITFDENELGTVYKKCEVVAAAPSPGKPVHQPAKCLSEVQVATSKEHSTVQMSEVQVATSKEHSTVQMLEVQVATNKDHGTLQTSSVTEPVHADCSPQRKKARRVVLQTLSTNVADLPQIPREPAAGKTEVTKNLVAGDAVLPSSEKCRLAANGEDNACDVPCGDQVENFSRKTNCDPTSGCEPESMEVCEEMPVAKVRVGLCLSCRRL